MVRSSIFRKIVIGVSFTLVVGVSLLFYNSISFSGLIAHPVRAVAAFALFASATLASTIHDHYPKMYEKPEDFPRLIQEKPYSLCRHPYYFLLIVSQICVAIYSLSYQALMSAILVLPLWYKLIQLEERELLERFGNMYEEYKKNVRSIIPLKRDKEFSRISETK